MSDVSFQKSASESLVGNEAAAAACSARAATGAVGTTASTPIRANADNTSA
jgi:hypothetical protein